MKKCFLFTAVVMLFIGLGFNESNASNSSVAISSEICSMSSDNDWDEFLDEYEEYVDQYIRIAKKAKNGDMSAITEMTSMLEKVNDLSEKIDKAEDDMTDAQLARYAKITSKMAKAAY